MQTLDLSRILETEDGVAVDGVLVVDAEGRVVFFNRRYAEMWGVPEDVLRDQSDTTLLGFVQARLVDPQGFLERVAHLYAHPEEEARDELALVDGRTFERFSGPLRNRDGSLYGRVWFFRDVTDQKTREASLRRQLDQLAAVYAMASAIEEAEDVESMTQEAFDTFERLLGADRVALLLADDEGVLRFVAWRGLSDDYRAAIESRSPQLPHVENPEAVSIPDVLADPAFADLGDVVRAEGLRAYAFIPLLHGGRLIGRLVAYFAVPRQLSADELQLAQTLARHLALAVARRQAEDALRLSRDELAAILGGVTDGITVQDPSGRLVYANDAAARLVGARSVEELVEAGPAVVDRFELLTEAGDPFPLDRLPGRLALAGEHADEVVIRWRRRDSGDERWSIVNATPVFGETGDVKLAINIFRDVTERRRGEERLGFLAEAGEALNRSLDYDETLREVARLAVPRISDWCVVYMVADDGRIERLAVEHYADRAARIREVLDRFPLDPEADEGVPAVVRSGKPLLLSDATSENVTRDVGDGSGLAAEIADLGVCSAMSVPLTSRGRTFGAISFISAESGRRFGEDDLLLAQELARRAATAVDNALLFTEAQESFALLDTVIATAPIAIAFWDRELRYVRVNDAMAELNGLSPEDHVGRRLHDVVPQLAPQLEPLYRRVLETGEPYVHLEQTTADLPLESGEERHWLSSYYPVRTADGEIVGLGAVIVEITERKRAEQERVALLEAERKTRALLERQSEASPDGLLVVDPDGRILSANRRFAEIWRMPADVVERGLDEEALGVAVAQVDDPDGFLDGVRAAYETRRETRDELRLRDGRMFERYGAPVVDEQGTYYGYLWSFRDITERREAEARERHQVELTRTITENATVALFMMDERGHATYMNAAAEAMTGWTLDEIRERPLHDVVHHTRPDGSPYPMSECPIDRALPQERTVVPYEDIFIRRDGSFFPVSASASPIFRDGRAVGTVVEVRDLTEEKKADAEREEAEKRLQILVAASEALSSTLDWRELVERVAQVAVTGFAESCHVYLVDGDDLVRVALAHADPAKLALVQALPERYAVDGDSLLARTFREGKAWHTPQVDEPFLLNAVQAGGVRPGAIEEIGTAAVVLVPLATRDEPMGIMSLSSSVGGRFDHNDVDFARELARRVAVRIENARLYEAERRARERLSFLASASEVLASSLDYHQTLANVAQLAVPALADWCAVEVVEDDQLRTIAVVHSDPEKVALARHMRERWPAPEDAPSGVRAVIRTGLPELVTGITEEMLAAVAQSDEQLELLRRLQIRGYVCVPLTVRGETIGAFTLVSSESERALTDADLELAQEIARRAAAALENARLFHEAEERAQAARVLDAVGDGVFLVDAQGIVRLWNPAAEQVTGLRRQDVVGRPVAEAIPGWSRAQALVPVADWPQAAAMHAETVPFDVGSRELWLSISGVGFADGTVYAFRDLTEERTVEQLKSDFVSTVSHELRTPLAAIYGAALTLGRSELQLEQDQQRRLLDVIAGEADRLARTVNDILWASRLDSGQLHVTIESCAPAELASTVVAAQRAHLPENVELTYEPPDGLPEVRADRDKLRQVLTNLLDNAVKYSPDGGRVELGIEQLESRVRFWVRDEGLGIPQAEQERIFEKFYRLDPQLTRGVGGTGLGLYICRELVRRMEGRLWVYSLAGRGSTFFVELPCV